MVLIIESNGKKETRSCQKKSVSRENRMHSFFGMSVMDLVEKELHSVSTFGRNILTPLLVCWNAIVCYIMLFGRRAHLNQEETLCVMKSDAVWFIVVA